MGFQPTTTPIGVAVYCSGCLKNIFCIVFCRCGGLETHPTSNAFGVVVGRNAHPIFF
ncbi:MAG: hypothetical protein IKH45_00030 [Neisseriaceae bacterium]|nr:hypothetical protein [Neisseriaceae bacterium]